MKKTAPEKNQFENSFREFAVGQAIWAQDYRGTSKWVEGEVIEQLSPVSYKVAMSARQGMVGLVLAGLVYLLRENYLVF